MLQLPDQYQPSTKLTDLIASIQNAEGACKNIRKQIGCVNECLLEILNYEFYVR